MRYALARGSHFCPTLFAVVVCPSLAICTTPTPHKTITVLYRRAFWVLLMIGDVVVPDRSVLHSLMSSLVLSRLHYCNATLAGFIVLSAAATVDHELSGATRVLFVEV